MSFSVSTPRWTNDSLCTAFFQCGMSYTRSDSQPWLHVKILRGTFNSPDLRTVIIRIPGEWSPCIKRFLKLLGDSNTQPGLRSTVLECPSNVNVNTNCLGV